jgi:AcrR family transcriptional regulator
MKSQVRQPQQERSIEKKNKIIAAGYELFSQVGFYSTNTAEIARQAGVSTGIVYGYFEDKRDIMISVLDLYIDKVSAPIFAIMRDIPSPVDLKTLVLKIIDTVVKTHQENERLHNTLHSLAATDEAVGEKFISLEDDLTKDIASVLQNAGLTTENALEKVHLAMDLVQQFAHEYVFDNHSYIDYEAMKQIVCKMIISMFD